MLKRKCKEWTVDTVWGKVATISWGEPDLPPVLMVHGFLDSAATFIPLVERLPESYFYVSFDFPGHGASDHMPVGPLATQTVFIEVLNALVTHFRWEQFTMVTHSLGFIFGIFYHNVFPGKISKMVNIDPLATIGNYHYYENEHSFWFHFHYEIYYESYKKNFEEPKPISREYAIKQVMATRDLNREQAELVLSRTLVPVGQDLYRYSWQPMAKKLVQLPVYMDIVEAVITTNPPPMLNLIATVNIDNKGLLFAKNIMDTLEKNPKNAIVYLDGPHDFHITDTDKLTPYIVQFLKRNKAKL